MSRKIINRQWLAFLSLVFVVSLAGGVVGSILITKPEGLARWVTTLNLIQPSSDPTWKTEKEIMDQIVREVPLLQSDRPVTQFEIVNVLREWTYLKVPVVFSEDELTLVRVKNVSSAVEVPLGERLYLFENGIAGIRCGGTAATLSSIYRRFGFEAYDLNMGEVGSEGTHVVTLVKIVSKGKELLSVQDAFFNYTLTDEEDRPLDYFEVISLLKQEKASEVYRYEGKSKEKFELISPGYQTDSMPKKVFTNGNILVPQTPSLKTFETSMTQFFAQHNLPPDLKYIYLFPFGIHGKDISKAQLILNRARRITGSWCFQDEGCLDI